METEFFSKKVDFSLPKLHLSPNFSVLCTAITSEDCHSINERFFSAPAMFEKMLAIFSNFRELQRGRRVKKITFSTEIQEKLANKS